MIGTSANRTRSGTGRNYLHVEPGMINGKQGPAMSLKGVRAALVFMITFALIGTCFAQTGNRTEQRFKAVYVLNFLRFVQWPDSLFEKPQSPLVVGIVGDGGFERILENAVSSETIGSHPIVVKRLRPTDKLFKCQALFIGASERDMIPSILKKTDGRHILTIGDIVEFGADGAIISFYLANNRLRFEINMGALKRSKLDLNAKLLKLAKIIAPPKAEQ